MSRGNCMREIIVTGSHRSGTSAVSTFLANLGINVGEPEKLIDAAEDNENGFFERLDVMAINDTILSRVHSRWDYLDSNALELLDPENVEPEITAGMNEILTSFQEKERTFLLKDPRFCLTLPVWLNCLKNPLIIVCLRNPLEIARSLQKREGFSVYKGLAIWESYLLYLGQITPDVDCIYVDFNKLLKEPEKYARLLWDELVLHGVRGLSNVDDAVKASFRLGLKHEEADAKELEMYLSSRQMKLWEGLVENKNLQGVDTAAVDFLNNEAFLQKNTGLGYAKQIIRLTPCSRENSPASSPVTHLVKDKQRFVFSGNFAECQKFILEPLNRSCVVVSLQVTVFSGDQYELIDPVGHNGIYDAELKHYYFPIARPEFVLQSSFTVVTRVEVEIQFASLDVEEIQKLLIDYLSSRYFLQASKIQDNNKSTAVVGKRWFLKPVALLRGVVKLFLDRVNLLLLIRHYQALFRHEALFSPDFYRKKNPDIQSSSIPPLLHFLAYGWREGRNPCPYFDVGYYLHMYSDVQESRVNPLLHYIDKGWREGRNPDSSFNTMEYLAANLELLQTGDNPLVHAASKEGKNAREKKTVDFEFSPAIDRGNLTKKLYVLIPVYLCRDEGIEAFSLLLRSLSQSYWAPIDNLFFLFIDDASPFDVVQAQLEKFEFAERADVIFIRNETNKGFVGTVNKGLRAVPAESDVVILNSDTEIHGSVFEILQRACYRHPQTASVTPLSNRATIACLTNWPLGEDICFSSTPEEIALKVEEIGLVSSDFAVPTAHGFCMYLSRDALNSTGLFDEKTFGDGYGEENDWSMRAIANGFKHTICTECYVHHHESRSFDSKRKQQLTEKNSKLLEQKHPYYPAFVRGYIRKNPLNRHRSLLQLLLMELPRKKDGKQTVCFVIHDSFSNCTGGVQHHVKQLVAELNKAGNYEVIVVAPEKFKGQRYEIHLVHGLDTILLRELSIDALGALLPLFNRRIDYLHVHHTLGLADVLISWIVALQTRKKVFSIHDYDLFCANPFMLNEDEEQSVSSRDECGLNTVSAAKLEKAKKLLREFDAIIVPSANCRRQVEGFVDDSISERIHVLPHCLAFADYVIEKRPQGGRESAQFSSNIVFLGSLYPHKGGGVFLQSCDELKSRGFNLLIFGHVQEALLDTCKNVPPVLPFSNWKELLTLKNTYGVGVAVMPSISVETFSYTLYEAIFLLGIPVVVGACGNPNEVVAKYKIGECLEEYTVNAVVEAVEKISAHYDSYLKAIDAYKNAAMADFTAGKYFEKYMAILSENSRAFSVDNCRESLPEFFDLSKASRQVMNRSLRSKPARKMRVLVVHGLTKDDPPFFFRVENPVEYMKKNGWDVVVAHMDNIPVDQEGFDLVYLSRTPESPEIAALLKNTKVNNIPTVLDVDDLIFHPGFMEKLYFIREDLAKYEEYQQLLHSMEPVFNQVDILLASTPEIAFWGEQYGKTSLVFRNRLRFSRLEKYRRMYSARPVYKEKLIGYFSGSNTHDDDFALLAPIVEKILRKEPEARLLVMGFTRKDLFADDFSSQIIYRDFSTYEEYLAAIQKCKVIVAPIAQINSFSHSKSNIKLLEAAAVGTPMIASPISEMNFVIESGFNGWIAEDKEDWLSVLQQVLSSDHVDYVASSINSYVMNSLADGSGEFCALLQSIIDCR